MRSSVIDGERLGDVTRASQVSSLYDRHRRGAWFRSAASLAMGFTAAPAYYYGVLNRDQFVGVSGSVAFLLLMNPLLLAYARRVDHPHGFETFSRLVNGLEILGYTAIIHFVGGLEAGYLVAIYCALIAYVAVVAPPREPVIVATICVVAFSALVVLERVGWLASYPLFSDRSVHLPWSSTLILIAVSAATMFVVAAVGVHTSGLLETSRQRLRDQNSRLESRVATRTAELARANQLLLTEVAERKLADEALTETENRLRTFVEGTKALLVSVDANGRFTFANEATAEAVGLASSSELTGKPYLHFVHPEDRQRVLNTFLDQANTYQPASLQEFRLVDIAGNVKWFSFLASLEIRDGQVVGQSGVAQDITKRKKAEEAILEEMAFSEAMLESLPGIFYLFDQTGRFLRWNHSFEAVSGYSAEEIAGLRPLDLFTGEDRTLIEERIGKVFETGAADAEGALTAKDGRQTPYYFTGRRIVVDGAPCCLGMGIDVTARKRLEAELQQAQKIEAIGQLAGGVAHDFNNILGVILGYGELAEAELEPGSPVREQVAEMLKAAQRAATLTRQLQAFSRKQILQPKRLDLNELVANAHTMLGRLIGEDITLVLRSAPELGTVRADPGQIDQILLNLAVNARDAMPMGGTLTLETANVDLHDDDAAADHPQMTPGRYVMIAVSDTGVGMDAETQRRIFEPFFTTKPVGQGTGLGLATVYGIVKQSDGYIWAYSEPDLGTTFKIYLPRVDELPDGNGPSVSLETAPGGRETILLVEDNPALRGVIGRRLEANGYTVVLAGDGAEALALAGAHEGEIDLLLTDVVMPNLGGGELARRLAALRPGVRVLFMSGYTGGAIAQHGVLEDGAVLLEKPFSGEKLARAVRDVLGRPHRS